MSKQSLLRLLFVVMIMALASRSYGTSPVVTLLVTTSEGTAFGTGSFISSDGLIVTCYHVIQGATDISVINQGQLLNQPITVETIDTTHDLATLRTRNVEHEYFPIEATVPSPTSDLRIFGYIAGNVDQSLTVHATDGKFDLSGQATDQAGRGIFALQDVDLILLKANIYNGMSGSPLTQNGRIIGVISGSITSDGNLAWAIPIKYLNAPSSRFVCKNAGAVKWPPLRLMGANWTSMRRQLPSNDFIDGMSDLVESALKVMEIASAAYPPTAEHTFQGIDELKLMIDAVPQSEDTLALDKSPSFLQISPLLSSKFNGVSREWTPFLEQLDDMNDALSEWDEAAVNIKEKLKTLASDEAVASVDSQLRELTDKIRDAEHSLAGHEGTCTNPGKQGDNAAPCPSSEAFDLGEVRDYDSVGDLRQVILTAVALEPTWNRQMSALKVLGDTMPQTGEVVQGLLAEKMLRNAEAHFPNK